MDTKWKKLKITCSFVCFFLGVTLFLCHIVPVIRLWRSGGEAVIGEADYQETGEFRWYVGDRLEEFLGVATGGKGWKLYGSTEGTVYRNLYTYDGTYDYGWDYSTEVQDRLLNEGTFGVVQEATAIDIPSERAVDSAASDSSWLEDYYDDYEDYWSRPRTRDEYMEEMARNKNLRYAIVYKNKLLYTNIDAYEGKTGKDWDEGDFYKSLDQDDYNFSLWYNRNRDGKVEIVKDGISEDVYGNGVYTKDSRWYVPGYANFNVDKSAKDAVVFLAVAKKPMLYITGNYSEYGASQYGSRLYYMQENLDVLRNEFKAHCAILAAVIVLLVISFIFRKEKRRADQVIGGFLRKIWLELKVVLFLLLAVMFFVVIGRGELQEITYLPWYGGYVGDISYYFGRIFQKGTFLAACFWLIYLLVLDVWFNRGHQKKPLITSIKTRDLKYPIQKRMVRRFWVALATVISALVIAVVLLLMMSWANNEYYLGAYHNGLWNLMIVAVLILLVFLIVCIIAGISSMGKNRRLAEDIGALSDQIAAVRAGNLTGSLAAPKDADLAQAAENLNEIQRGLEEALREQMHSERMKVELVTNVSHDIKTPLTAIISYVELLRQEEELPVHVQEFVQILWEKSQRLKTIVQDVFDVSKATAGQLPVKLEELDLGRLLRQVQADMDTQIAQSGLIMKNFVSDEPLFIRADGQRLYRVFQNLIQNALKYSLAGSRIYLTMTEEENHAAVYIKNTSGTELTSGVDFAERFVRGDSSRTDGGSGLGLSIAKSFTEACGGSFRVETDADLFTVVVVFPVVEKES